MKYLKLTITLLLFVNFAFGQKKSTPEKGFALVQSRAELEELNPLKGKKVQPIPFDNSKALYPIKKYGNTKQENSNAIYIQDNVTIRVFVFQNGFPKNFDLRTFNPAELTNTKAISQVKEDKDIVLDVDFEQQFFSTLRPNRTSSRLLNYYARTINGSQVVEFSLAVYNNSDIKFSYKKCADAYDINAIKTAGNSTNNNNYGQRLLAAKVYPTIVESGRRVDNGYFRYNKQADAATDFHILRLNSPLKMDTFGFLDLEKSDADSTEGNELCNTVGYKYKDKYYQLNFRYARRNDGYRCTSGQSCGSNYRQNIVIPQSLPDFNLRTNPNSTLPQIIDLMIICVPDEGDVTGKPKPE